MSLGPSLGDAFGNIFDALAPIILDIADAFGLGIGGVISFFFGGIDFLLSEFLFG